jgi:hypothetical protein
VSNRNDPPAAFNRHFIQCMGDSLTNNQTLGVYEHEFWPEQLARFLRQPPRTPLHDGTAITGGLGCAVQARNLGHNGNYSGPLPVASDTVNGTTTNSTTLVVASGAGFLNGSTIVVDSQITQIASGGGTTTLNLNSPVSATNGHTVYALSILGADAITRFAMILGRATPKHYDFLFQYGPAHWDPPDAAVIFIGANDPAGGIAPHITGLNLNTTVKTAPSNSVAPWPQGTAGYTSVPLQTGQGANAVIGQMAVILDPTTGNVWAGLVIGVSGDTIRLSANPHALDPKTAPLVNWCSAQHNPLPTLPPVGALVLQGTTANIQWMIQMLLNAGCAKIMVSGYHFLNYSAGQGDVVGTPAAFGATLRAAQLAAVTAMASSGQIIYNDAYTYMSNLVANATPYNYGPAQYAPVAGDHAWHVQDTNQHLNALGHSILAASMLATIKSQPGWVNDLRL